MIIIIENKSLLELYNDTNLLYLLLLFSKKDFNVKSIFCNFVDI